jgi:hypothetical protein
MSARLPPAESQVGHFGPSDRYNERLLMAHSAGSQRFDHCPVAEVERTPTGGGESGANDPLRSFTEHQSALCIHGARKQLNQRRMGKIKVS